MRLNERDLDAFCQWLCEHEDAIVGRPGMIFHCPLARWMSEISGHIYGVDGRLYGRACTAFQRWLLLPRWAEIFGAWSLVRVLSSNHRRPGADDPGGSGDGAAYARVSMARKEIDDECQ